MAHRFPRGHAATKKMIASCAASGVGIEGIEGAPGFRFVPAAEKAPPSSFSNGSEYGEPSKRSPVTFPRPPHMAKVKNWRPVNLGGDSMYQVAMAGDGWKLNEARRAYAKGNPDKLRAYLAAEAAKRRAAAEPVQLAMAA